MTTPKDIADRYVALWNEGDFDSRRRAIAAFFAPGARHYVNTREAVGHDALEQRIQSSHEKNVRDGGNRFRAVQDAQQLRDVLIFHWEMVPAAALDTVSAVGLEVITLGEDGRAVSDHQFIVG